MTLIDQNKNYTGSFGSIFRSSAIFYLARQVKTTISVLNYWKYKNDLDVTLIVTVRDMMGRVISREEETFDGRGVINWSSFNVDEGSVEIEAMGGRNLRIPYAAVMAVYEATNSISMVHSYARNHSLIEIEDGHALTQGREGCWSIRAADDIENCAVFHNGHLPCEAQQATLFLTNAYGSSRAKKFIIPELPAFATYVFYIAEIMPHFGDHLNGADGWATVHFENHSAFTRMLLFWQRRDGSDFQATHSNFDYETLETNLVETAKPALMKLPVAFMELENRRVCVYPNFRKGVFEVSSVDASKSFSSGFVFEKPAGNKLSFVRHDGNFPSRLVTALSGALPGNALAFECSLGVMHEKAPPKRFHWIPISVKHSTHLHLVDFHEFKEVPDDIFIAWKLYNNTEAVLEYQITLPSLSDVCAYQALEDIFPNAPEFLGDEYGYITLFSNFAGFLLFASMKKKNSMTIEHSF